MQRVRAGLATFGWYPSGYVEDYRSLSIQPAHVIHGFFELGSVWAFFMVKCASLML